MTVHDGAPGSVVELRHVSKSFRRGAETVRAVVSASLSVELGALVVVRGPSGSGKTTLLNLVLGWDDADEGAVHRPAAVAGGRGDWSRCAVVPQRLGLLEHLTVEENVTLPGRAVPLPEEPLEVMRRLGIGHLADRFPGETSLGEQQRVACARALVAAPRLLVADEPTSHQDEANALRITDELRAAAARGSAVLVATHDARVAASATRCYDLLDGVLTESTA